ncbi:hypothetical protein MMC11_008353 [Xylographa trunciseda]|nr:hypothetical protein [Xylographa trunciseda]
MELKWGTFVCGLPEEAFDWAILWQQWSPLVRPRAFDTGSQSTGRFFPTWSWAGWHGGVYNHDDLDFRRARSRIIWHPSEVDSTIPAQRPFVSDAAFYSTAIHQPSLVKKSKRSPTVVMDRITELGLESGVLEFWASCAVFRLRRETYERGRNLHSAPGSEVAAYSVYGRQGAWIGQAVLHELSDDLPLSVDPHHLTFHKFICFSQAVKFRLVSCHAPGRLRFFEYRDDDIYEEELAKMSEGGAGDGFVSKEPTHNWLGATKWNWFNVLIVRPSHELPRDNPPSYLRAGIGMIRRTAWKAAKPEWRLIHLR